MHNNYRFTNNEIQGLSEELCKTLKTASFREGDFSNTADLSSYSVSSTVLYYSVILSWGLSCWLDKEN